MSVASSIGNFFKKLFSKIKELVVRSGLDKFIADHWDEAVLAFIAEAKKHPGVPFHQWKDILRGTLKETIKTDKDNWLEILIALVLESAKAKRLI